MISIDLRACLIQLFVACALAASTFSSLQEPARNGGDPRGAAELEVEGWKLFEREDLDGARERFEAAAALGSLEARRGLAEIHRRRGAVSSAEHELRSIHEARPEDGAALRELAAIVALDPERRPEAVELLRRACALGPDDAQTRLRLGCVLAWCGHHGEARAELGRVVDTATDPALVWAARIQIANTLAWSGAPRAALDAYAAILAERRAPDALRELANLETWRGRPGHALALYAECGQATGDPLADRRRERVRYLLGDFAEGALQFFGDSQDWRRVKLRTGWSRHTAGDSELALDLESSWYRDGAGEESGRELLVARYVRRPSPLTTLEVEIGGGVIEGGESDWIGGLTWSSTVRDGTDVTARYRHDDLADEGSPSEFQRYNLAQSVSALEDEHLRLDTLELGASQRLGPRTTLDGFGRWSAISDGNERLEGYLALRRRAWDSGSTRGFVRGWYWTQGFERSEPLYYSPEDIDSYGLSLRAEGVGEFAPWFADAGPYYQPSPIDAWGWYAETGLRRRASARLGWSFGLHHFESGERGGSYDATALMLELTWRL